MPGSTVVLTLLLKIFTRLAHCATLVYASVRYKNLQFSTLYLVISYEDNTKLLTLFLEVFTKTCTLQYTSFWPRASNPTPHGVGQTLAFFKTQQRPESSFPMPVHESRMFLRHIPSSALLSLLCRKKFRGQDEKQSLKVHSHSFGALSVLWFS